jgi:hypothetical protein
MHPAMLPSRCRIELWLAVLVAAAVGLPSVAPAGEVSYLRQVRPILSNTCFKCHGPDSAERQAELRLDLDPTQQTPDSGLSPVVPGKPDESELVRRIDSADPADQMPPPDSGKSLTDEQKALIKAWIVQGARSETHWAFVPPRRPPLPAASADPSGAEDHWSQNPVDRFVLARLRGEGLFPSAEADRRTIARRLSLDLTGLPPTPAEAASFERDSSPDAYERFVERLVHSPRFGERMTLDWLDASRFADTHGYHIDSGRDMTRWREWVIAAFNGNLPLDQFITDQIAGDLLPAATLDQRIASGFHRNHMINFEGGAIPEEYHTAYIVDRVNTTGTVFLGLSVGCAQCHDHKFDPLTQREYYQLFAFFHNVPEKGLDGSKGNASPLIAAPTPEEELRLARLDAAVARLQADLSSPRPELDAAQRAWEVQAAADRAAAGWTIIAPAEMTSEGGAQLERQPDDSILAKGPNPDSETYRFVLPLASDRVTALRLETLADDTLAGKGPGRSSNGNFVISEVTAELISADGPPQVLGWKRVAADYSQRDFPAESSIDGKLDTGWAIYPEAGKSHWAVFEFAEPLSPAAGSSLVVTVACKSSYAKHQPGRLRLAVTAATDPNAPSRLPDAVLAALSRTSEERSDADRQSLQDYFRRQASTEFAPLVAQLASAEKERADLAARVRTAMVMQEMPDPRETFLLIRGQYDRKGERVQPGLPASLPPLPPGAPENRLGLAQWLTQPDHPLVSRVIVNRLWQAFFGAGIVRTSEDFGSQGDLPSHPELLDWLATELVRSGWNVKHVVRLIVTSATYRQSSAVTPDLLKRDPENRLLARGPRFRLSAEAIRDQALAASGLLEARIGGASVSPYQPPGLWEELMSREDGANWTAQTYVQSHGADLYRRTMYTFWKRTSPPPTLATFDAPDRETCTVRRARTNTPLQALILWNDPTYVEAARQLAERVLEGSTGDDARIAAVMERVLARPARAEETAVLRRVLDKSRQRFRADGSAALRLLDVGEVARNPVFDPAELAAWTIVAQTVLNLDEALTRG